MAGREGKWLIVDIRRRWWVSRHRWWARVLRLMDAERVGESASTWFEVDDRRLRIWRQAYRRLPVAETSNGTSWYQPAGANTCPHGLVSGCACGWDWLMRGESEAPATEGPS